MYGLYLIDQQASYTKGVKQLMQIGVTNMALNIVSYQMVYLTVG